MNLKGMDELRKHLPDLETSGGRFRLISIFLLSLAATIAFFDCVDLVIPDWMPDGEIIVIALAFLILARFFARRNAYQQRYGELAYRNAFVRFVLPGLGVLFASIAHLAYMPGPE